MEIKEIAHKIKEMKPEDRQKLAEELEISKPSIFERFPVGSHICGMKVLNHDKVQLCSFDIEFRNGNSTWIEKELAETLAACHEWIEKYHPFLREYRAYFKSHEGQPQHAYSILAKEVGLWASATPVKKPWEETNE